MSSKRRRVLVDALIFVMITVLGLPLLRFGYRRYLQVNYPLEYTEIVSQCAKEYALSESLVFGVIYTESRFNAKAVSSAGAKGLMQIMDTTFDWAIAKLGEESGDVFDPETNIRCGTKLLEYLSSQFENPETALAAYNAGIGNVRKWLKDAQYSDDGKTLHTIPFPETAEYVKRVLKAQKMYQTLYEIP